MVFFFEIKNIWQKSRRFFLEIFKFHRLLWIFHGFSRKMDESEKGKQTPVPSPQKEIQRLGPVDLKIYCLEKNHNCDSTSDKVWRLSSKLSL
jgi:hypothetical protein